MMLVSMRCALLVIVVASACGGSIAREGGDDGTDAAANAYQCSAPVACPAPSSGKQTICGQLYDLQTNAKLGDTSVGTACSTTTTGPCSLAITAYDALAFGQNPASVAPLQTGSVEIDSCGRFRVTDITITGISPFVALVIDDAAGRGPTGTTVTTAIATPKIADTATAELEAWIVTQSTTAQWAASGGPALSAGVFVPLFRAHNLGTPDTDPFEPQAGVTVTKNGFPISQFYFEPELLDRTTIAPVATTTGVNGTALIANAMVAEGVAYGGSGGFTDAACRWQPHVGMSLPGVVFVQIFRPLSVVGQQCSL
jgi:hypothetical protein